MEKSSYPPETHPTLKLFCFFIDWATDMIQTLNKTADYLLELYSAF